MNKICLILFSIVLLVSCQNSSQSETLVISKTLVTDESNKPKSIPTLENITEEIWIPDSIKECLASADSREPIEVESAFNPYYLRGNLDGNGIVDFAVLVRSVQNKQVRGLLICKDSKTPFLFGAVSKSDTPFSDMSDDNFITDNWEILTENEIKDLNIGTKTDVKIGKDAKAEGIGFFFEGGGFFVYWDGKKFKGAGGV